MKLTYNVVRIILAANFYWLQNSYFGWNRKPQSPEEVLADGIFLLILALSFGVKEAR